MAAVHHRRVFIISFRCYLLPLIVSEQRLVLASCSKLTPVVLEFFFSLQNVCCADRKLNPIEMTGRLAGAGDKLSTSTDKAQTGLSARACRGLLAAKLLRCLLVVL